MSSNSYMEMGSFFNKVVEGYDDKMRGDMEDFDQFYRMVAGSIQEKNESIEILDLGCGTGAELQSIFEKVPNAKITGIDLSDEMLEKLRDKYRHHSRQIVLIKDSYETLKLPEKFYDYVVTVMSLHHFKHERKLNIFKKVKSILKPGGIFINGDYIVSSREERECLEKYDLLLENGDICKDVLYHIDTPFSVSTEIRLLEEAGFKKVDVLYRREGAAIIAAVAEEPIL